MCSCCLYAAYLQFGSIGEQGTRIIIYNLWEDDEGELELDFDADANVSVKLVSNQFILTQTQSATLLMLKLQDIQIRGVNRDQNKIQKANQFPNSKHFFTYRHSLRVSFRCTYAFVPVSFFYIL